MPPQEHILEAESLPVLLHELIVEILSWLPVKSLVRFMCVSKSWKSLISDPHFVKLHLHRSTTNPDFPRLRLISQINDFRQMNAISCSVRSLLYNPSSIVAEQHVCNRLQPAIEFKGCVLDNYWVVGSCNGLLCLAGLFIGEIYHEHWVCLWNPSTRLRSKNSPIIYVNWHYERYGSTAYGFGYDHISDTYKVAVIFFSWVQSLVKIFSVGDNRWREIQSFPAVPSIRQNDGVYLSGSNTLNWVVVRVIDPGFVWDNLTVDRLVIVSLDLGKETLTQLLMPRGLDEVPHVMPTLAVLRDCLCICHDYKRTHFVVWQMKEFGVENSWTQLVNVSYENLQTGCLEFRPRLLPLFLSENGDVLMVLKSAESPATLFKWRDNGLELSKIPNNVNWIHPRVYVESLVLPC